MTSQNEENKSLLPHHVQQPLCTTRLAYRQGRKLTAVKVYTINDESAHLLVFGVPSLNLRQETKSLFCKFGKLLQFNITNHPSEQFTETYHALYERIQSSRIAKKMLDGKNFYGGVLHVCYAPELESLEELRSKLMQRRREVYNRLKNNEIDRKIKQTEPIDNCKISEEEINVCIKETAEIISEIKDETDRGIKMNMAEVNVISFGKRKKKVKEKVTKEKRMKDIEVVDCTNVDNTTVTNVYEVLNEKVEIRAMPQKSLNKIVFFNK